MTLRTCADCMHWQPPHSQLKSEKCPESKSPKKPAYGYCNELVVDPRSKRVMPESEVDCQDRWNADPFRTAGDFNACRGWAPSNRQHATPKLTVLKGGMPS